jgi:hypothetical protein
MSQFKILFARETEVTTLLHEGWRIAGACANDGGPRIVLVPPLQFEVRKVLENCGNLVLQHKHKAPTLEGRIEDELTRLGAEGWELVQIVPSTDGRKEFWLRREKRECSKFVSHAGTDGPTTS